MRKGYGGILQKDHWKGCKLTTSLPVTLLDTLCSVELIKRKTPPWIVLIWSTLHDDGSIFGLYHQHRQYFSCQFFLLVPFQTGLSAPKNAKIADSNHKLSFHSRRIPVDTGQPFTATWKVVMVEKMLFEDSLVCHDPPSARISPSNDSLPPPCRSTAGMRALSARFCLVEVRNHARISRTHVTPWNGWLCQMCMVIDRPRPRSTCSVGAGEEVSHFSVSVFCTSLLWLRHFSLSAQVCCCCRREWQS